MFEEATMLQRPDNRGYSGRVDFTEENIEKYYPEASYTRYTLWCSSCSPYVHPGFYSIAGWQHYQEERRKQEEKRQRQEAYRKSWRGKRDAIFVRLHRAYDAIRGRYEDDC